MPLGGTGPLMGGLLLSAVGGPPAAGGLFAAVGSTIASWAPGNLYPLPGSMTAAGAAVTGSGKWLSLGAKEDLGLKLATAIGSTDPGNVKYWTIVAGALIAHFITFGGIDPSGFVVSNPTTGGPLGGSGKLTFSAPTFVPPLATQMGLSDPGNVLALTAFTAALLNHLTTNGTVVALALAAPFVPFTAPPGGGPITGSGSLT